MRGRGKLTCIIALGAIQLKIFSPINPFQPHNCRVLAEAGLSSSPISQLKKLTQGQVAAVPRSHPLRGAFGIQFRG